MRWQNDWFNDITAIILIRLCRVCSVTLLTQTVLLVVHQWKKYITKVRRFTNTFKCWHNPYRSRGATTAEKLRGARFGSLHLGACSSRPATGRAGCWVRCEGPGVLPPENFLKTQMLNPAFWWLLCLLVGSVGRVYPSNNKHVKDWLIECHWSNNTCCEISCFLKTTAKKLGETNTLLVPQLSPPYGCRAWIGAFAGFKHMRSSNPSQSYVRVVDVHRVLVQQFKSSVQRL